MNELEWHEVECKNIADSKFVCMVVREVEDDEFIGTKDKENTVFCTKYYFVHDTTSEFSENYYAQTFWAL